MTKQEPITQQPFSAVFADMPLPPVAGNPLVRSVRISRKRQTMELELFDHTGTLPDAWLDSAHSLLCRHYGLTLVNIRLERAPRPSAAPSAPPPPEAAGARMLLGKPFTTRIRPIAEIGSEIKRLAVRGRIYEVEEKDKRRVTRDGTKISLRFDLGDESGGVRVADYLPVEQTKLLDSLEKLMKSGDTVEVCGRMELDHYRQTWTLRPAAIRVLPRVYRRDDAPVKRVELHLHTQMSARDATAPVTEVIAMAARWGHPAVAITDHGVCHSFPDAMKAAKKHGVQVIYGVEGYTPPQVGSRNHHIILLAKNETGLRNLYKLVSQSHVKYFKRAPLIPREVLEQHREGLIVGSACEAGDLFRAVIKGYEREQLLDIARFYDYLEIQPISNNHFMIRERLAQDEEQLREFNRTILSLGDELGIPVCATGDVHFIEPDEEIYRRVLLSVKSLDDGEPLPLYLRTTEEMLREFAYLGDRAHEVVIDNPRKIAELCQPIQPIRDGEFSPVIEGSAETLRSLCYEKAHRLFGDNLPPLLEERIHAELNPITKKGYDVIYMIAQKLVQRSLQNGYYVGSRGSVGSSIVAYMAGITEVNALPPHYLCVNEDCKYYEFPEPEERGGASCGVDMPDKDCPRCGQALTKDGFDLNFATFLGFFADKKPDIDLNFSDEYQSRAHAHTVELFGGDNVFRAGTIASLQSKNAKGYAKKFLEKEGLDTENEADLSRLAFGCIGVKSSTGQHPGGLVVVPQGMDINEFCPVHYPADDDGSMITTHFDYHSIEDNLLKLDLLGHKDPTMIRALSELTGVDVMDIPLDDPATMSLFTSSAALGYEGNPLLGDTGAVAVPEFGTQFVRGMLIATQPKCFDDLLRISGLSHGTNVWKGNQEDLVLQKVATLRDIICSRDDIMLYLISRGLDKKMSFEIMESVRKGKGLKPDWEAEMRRVQTPHWYIESCRKISYMFPKAHAVAYVMMAFRVAWFKVHRPLAFYCAYFTKRAKHFDAVLMTRGITPVEKKIRALRTAKGISDMEKNQLVTLEVVYEYYLRGFAFDGIDLMKSHAADFRFSDTPDRLIPPFTAIPGLGEAAAESVVAERGKEPFISIEEIQMRTKLNKSHIDALRELGALTHLPESTQISLF